MSQYVNPTGEGYQGVWTTQGHRGTLNLATMDCLDWETDADAVAITVSQSYAIAIVERQTVTDPDRIIDEFGVSVNNFRLDLRLTADALRALDGFQASGDIRAYARPGSGFYIVPAAADPFEDNSSLTATGGKHG